MVNVGYFVFLTFVPLYFAVEEPHCPQCVEFDCFHHRQIFDINDTFTLRYTYFTKDCHFTLRIPNFSYFTINYTLNTEVSESMYGFSADMVESIDTLGEVSAVLNQSNVVISGPTLSLDFPRSYWTTYYEEFTVKRNDIPLFEKVERITITSTSKPLYYQMNDFVPGVTYIFESENGVYAWHPGCEHELFANYSEYYRVFLFNGTDKNAKPLGNLAYRLDVNGECNNGLELLRGLIVIAVKPLNFSNPELSKLLIMDKSVVDKFYPMSLFFFDWAWSNGYMRYVTYAGSIFGDDVTSPTYFVMINYEEHVKYDCIFVGLGNTHFIKKESMPLIEVYTGWPIDIQANRSNLVATYSQGNRYTNLPQRFQGPVFTFVVWQPASAAGVGPVFANPTANGTILYRSIGGMNPIFSYKGRPILDFEPFNGRHGIIRNDWQDGRPGVLELYENVNATVFNFTFFFEPDCDPAAILFVTISSNLTSTNHTSVVFPSNKYGSCTGFLATIIQAWNSEPVAFLQNYMDELLRAILFQDVHTGFVVGYCYFWQLDGAR